LPVTHEIRRLHDGSVISSHCNRDCALAAFERLSLAQLMGEDPLGPLQWVEAHLVELASGQTAASTRGLVPFDGRVPPEVLRWP
jgi:hypothetical protein